MTVSVVICTRDRGDLIETTLSSLFAGTRCPDEIWVIDQSDGEETCHAVAAAAARHPELRYFCTATRGLSRARNAGLAQSRGDLIVFTDDDVVAAPDWLAEVVAEFTLYPRLAFLFGAVLPPDGYDWRAEFVPHCESPTRRPVHWFRPEVFGGMGANMALRRTTVERIGGFDTALGAGTGTAGEDFEYALRCTSHFPPLEMHLLEDARVVHHAGARAGADYHRFVHQVNGTGMGLFWAHLCRRGVRERRPQYVARALLSLMQPPVDFLAALSRGQMPSGLRTYAHCLQGFLRGLRLGLMEDSLS